jgi:hypothetical protein
MRKRNRKPPWKPTLQTLTLVEVTDPAEWAELDRRCRAALKAGRVEHMYEPAPSQKRKPSRRK